MTWSVVNGGRLIFPLGDCKGTVKAFVASMTLSVACAILRQHCSRSRWEGPSRYENLQQCIL
eukprot:7237650-Pyramimonas_sp.AAC.1